MSKQNAPERYSQALVRVWVQAANEGPPRFQQPLYEATLVENTPVGSTVTTVLAVDSDEVRHILSSSIRSSTPPRLLNS